VHSHKSLGRRVSEFVADAILLLLCLLPSLYLSAQALQEPWTMFRIARSSLSLEQNHVATFATSAAGYRGEHIGGEMIQVALIAITHLPLEVLGLLPLGSLLLAVLYYAIAQMVSPSRWTVWAISLYASWYYPLIYSQYGTQTYVWSHILFLTFLLLFLLWLRGRTPLLSILIMIVFVAAFLHYHTTPLWIIAALMTAIIAYKLKERSQPVTPSALSWSLVLFCIVVYFAFDTVIYGNGLARLSTGVTGESFAQSIIGKIITPLFFREPRVLNVFEIAPVNPAGATFSTLLVLLTLTLPVGFWCLRKGYQVLVTRNISLAFQTGEAIFVWSIVFTAVAHLVIYSAYGAVSIRVIPVAFPLLLPLITREFRLATQLEHALTSALALFAVIGFLSFAPTLIPDIMASQTGLASKLFQSGNRLMGDANVYGSILLNSVKDNRIIDFTWLDSEKYGSLIEGQTVQNNEFDYVIVDMTGKPLITLGWVFLEPWSRHLAQIIQNPKLDKIYDSENLAIFQPAGRVLPAYQLVSQDVRPNYLGVDQGDILQLGLAVLVLFFLPGFILLFIALRHSQIISTDWGVLRGLTIGLSVTFVTFIGYLTNFSPLGLNGILPLSLTLPWLALVAELLLHRKRFTVSWSVISPAASLITITFIWAFLALSVAQGRAGNHAEYTEFFATQEDSEGETITLNVVNRLAEPENFEMVAQLPGQPSQIIGLRIVAPGAIWRVTWEIPGRVTPEWVVITLERKGVAYHELRLSSSVFQ
jgi:hypothetical protein